MNRVSIVMEARPENISFARVAVTAFMSPLDPNLTETSDVKTAVSEAVTNAVIHGGGGHVKLDLSIQDKTLTVEVADEGVGIDDIAAALEPMFTTKSDMERSGLGFTLMESFMDTVSVESAPGVGTTVTMTKKLGD